MLIQQYKHTRIIGSGTAYIISTDNTTCLYLELLRKLGRVVLNSAHSNGTSLFHAALSPRPVLLAEWNDVPTRPNIVTGTILMIKPHPLVAGALYETTPLTTPPM